MWAQVSTKKFTRLRLLCVVSLSLLVDSSPPFLCPEGHQAYRALHGCVPLSRTHWGVNDWGEVVREGFHEPEVRGVLSWTEERERWSWSRVSGPVPTLYCLNFDLDFHILTGYFVEGAKGQNGEGQEICTSRRSGFLRRDGESVNVRDTRITRLKTFRETYI